MTKFPKYDSFAYVYCNNGIEYLHKKDSTPLIKELLRFGWLKLVRDQHI